MRRLLHLFFVFAASLGLCVCLLVAVCALVPRQRIHDSCVMAEQYFFERDVNEQLFQNNYGSCMDHYADAALLDVVYCADSAHPLHAVLAAPYYRTGGDIREDFRSAVSLGLAPNSEYARYWHGMQLFVRPLLAVTSLSGCRLIVFFIAMALLGWAALLMLRARAVRPPVILAAALVHVQFYMAAFTLEYAGALLVMAGACLAVAASWRAIADPDALHRRMTAICVASGALVCFFDFLTAETVAFTVPALLLLMLRRESRMPQLSIRQAFLLLVRWGAAWLAAYAGAFLCKWLLVLATLGGEAFLGVFKSAAVRVDPSLVYGGMAMMLARNLACLFPNSQTLTVSFVFGVSSAVLFSAFVVFYLFRGRKTDWAFVLSVLAVGCIPYLRFFALSSHSNSHFIFTFRAQMATLMALYAALAYSLNPAEAMRAGRPDRQRRR